ncbi:MAG: DUF2807 domain-containing protein [Saprospiraceae bacterium]|nr:DUF2807 domain-containing protein [Saprospiraceae bacterium]
MKHIFNIATVMILLINTNIFAQNAPLKGSGKISTLRYSKTGYDKINLLDLEGKIEILIGQPHYVVIDMDDNLAGRVEFELNEAENELTISMAGNKNGRLYLENINARIKITMPEASVIKHRGNSNIVVSGITGRYFRLEQQGNGDAVLKGNIDELEISKTGNGDVLADNLDCISAGIHTIGNGDIKIKASDSFGVKGTGNGDVIQVGKGSARPFSNIIGNGKIIKNTL